MCGVARVTVRSTVLGCGDCGDPVTLDTADPDVEYHDAEGRRAWTEATHPSNTDEFVRL
jgi:hypothetical protein